MQASIEVAEKLRIGEETEKKINVARMEYLPVATRASLMYFLIAETNLVSNMYNTSLAVFLRLFDKALDESDKSPVPQKRIENIVKYSTFAIFRYVTRGLFSNHKVLFMLQLALRIDLMAGRIVKDQFNLLIKGGSDLDINKIPRQKPFGWIPDVSWMNIFKLSSLQSVPQFRSLPDQIAANEAGWRAWYDHETPETAPMPDGYDRQDRFNKLVRTWRDKAHCMPR